MKILVSFIPLVLVVILTAWFRRPAFIAAWCGVIAVMFMMLTVSFLQIEWTQLAQGLGAAGIITLQAAFVIVPGLYLNALLSHTRVHEGLISWFASIPMEATHKRLIIVVGLAPALESLTGFGVSLLITVPLLLACSERRIALRQSMLSMNIMPWGTLALATVVGAQLSGQNLASLGFFSSLISFSVFPAFAILTTILLVEKRKLLWVLQDSLFAGSTLSISLIIFNKLGINEMAGILAGFLTSAACLILFRQSHNRLYPPWASFKPYILILGLVGLIRTLLYLGIPINYFAIAAGGVRFAPLASPGLALSVTILILTRCKIKQPLLGETLSRAAKPVMALGGFTVLAQLMVASGMVRIIGTTLSTTSLLQLSFLSPLLGMLSGYLTGSNVGGNALMMTMQSSLGSTEHVSLALSAIQNSSAGHAVFASLPIILLVLAIAGKGEVNEESDLVRFGIKTLILVAFLLIGSSLLLINLYPGFG